MSDSLSIKGEVSLDTSNAEQALGRVEQGAGRMAQAFDRAGEGTKKSLANLGASTRKAAADAGRGMAAVGEGGEKAARDVERATKSIQANLQRLIAEQKAGTKNSREYWEAIAGFRGVNPAALKPLLDQLDSTKAKALTASTALSQMGGALSGIGFASASLTVAGFATATLGLAKAAFDASIQAERLRIGLDFASAGRGRQELAYVTELSNKLGLSLQSTAEAYTGFAAAARGTALEGQGARQVFEAVSKAASVMGLSSGQASGALLALQQMVSKGVVSAEELRGQLGERLPGAFQIAARAMGVTTQELGNMLQAGTVLAEDFLPKFARQLEQELAGAAERGANRLEAAVNRSETALFRLKVAIGDGGVGQAGAGLLNFATTWMDQVARSLENLNRNGGLRDAANEVRELNHQAAQLRARMDGGAIGPRFQAELDQLLVKLDAAKKKFRELDATLQGETVSDPRTGQPGRGSHARFEAEQAKAAAGLVEVRTRLSGVNKTYLEDLKKLQEALRTGAILEKDYVREVSELATETYKSSAAGKADKATLSGINAEQNAYEGLIASIRTKLETEKAELAGAGALTDSAKLRIKLDEDLTSGKLKLSAAHEKVARAALEELATVEQQRKAQAATRAVEAERAQFAEELAQAYVADDKARTAGRLAVQEYARSIEEQNDALQYELSLMGLSERARGVALEQYKIELELKKQLEAIDKNQAFDEVQREEQRVKARTAAALAQASATSRAYLDQQKEAFQQQVDGLREVDQAAREVFRDVSENGVSAFKRIGQTLKTAVLDLLYQATLRPFIIQIAGSLTGSSSSAIAQAIGGNGGNGGGIGGLFNNAQSAYNLYNGGAANYASQVGSWFGAGPAASGTFAGAGGTAAGADMSLFYSGSQFGGAGGASGAGGAGALGGAGTMAAGAGALAVIGYAILQTYKESLGEKRSGATFGYDAATGRTTMLTKSSGDRPEGADAAVTALINTTVQGLNDTFKAVDSKIRVTDLKGAWEASMNDRGGVFSGGTLSNGVTFGESGKGTNYDPENPFESKYEWWGANGTASMGWRDTKGGAVTRMFGSDPGMDMDGDPAKLATDMKQSFIAALQASVGIIPTITEKRTRTKETVGMTEAGDITQDVDSFEWIRTFDKEMKDRARELGQLPKRILDLIIDIDPETLSDSAVTKLTTKIQTMVANVNGFRQIVDTLPMEKLKNLSFDAAAGLVKVAGGLETLQANLGSYFQNFYSDDEQRQQVAKSISNTLKGAGLNLSAKDILGLDRDEFRDLVEKYEGRTNYAGQKLYTTLLSVAGAFASITPALDGAGKAAEDAAKAAEKAAAAQAKVDTARDALRDAYSRESDALRDIVGRHRDYARQLRDVRDSLLLSDLSPLSAKQQTARAGADFSSTLKKALKLDGNALDRLGGVGTEYLQLASESARTPVEYAMAFAKVQAGLTTAAAAADGKATTAEKQLKAMDKQLSALGLVNESVLSVKTALKEYLGALSAAGIKKPKGFADGGLAVGGVIVGERGEEYADFKTPARVYTAEQTRGMLAPNPDIGPAVRELLAEIKALRADTRNIGNASVTEQQKAVLILKKFDTIGMPAERAAS